MLLKHLSQKIALCTSESFQTTVCVSLESEFGQVEALIPADEAVVVVLLVCFVWVGFFGGVVVGFGLGFFLHVYKHIYIKEMGCSGSLEQYGDSCHKLSVGSHLLLSLKFSSAEVCITIALFVPFAPCFLSYSEAFWHLGATLHILHAVLPWCPSVITLLPIIPLDWHLFLLGGSSNYCGSNVFIPFGTLHPRPSVSQVSYTFSVQSFLS